MKHLFISLSLCLFSLAALAEKTYKNPVIFADYSDPDVCAVGGDYYMTASSFNCSPGLPILHSQDLVNWEIINYALPVVPNDDVSTNEGELSDVKHGNCVWAPAIRFHKGYFYIYYGDPDYGIYMVKTDNIRGRWSEPICVVAGKGYIDTCPLWDDDGRVYLAFAWANSRSRINAALELYELNAEGTAPISEPVLIYDGTSEITSNLKGHNEVNYTLEGPKLYKRNGYYYIMAPAGGVGSGWQLTLRSKNIYGPYESHISQAQGSSKINGPHQGGYVSTPDGEDWFLHFQENQPYGRLVHLNPMQWINDWPVIGIDKDGDGCGEPVSSYRYPKTHIVETESYDTKPVSNIPMPNDTYQSIYAKWKQWQWHANYQHIFGHLSNLGFARVYSHLIGKEYTNLWDVPNLYMMKLQDEAFVATAKLKISTKNELESKSGVVVMGRSYSSFYLHYKEGRFVLEQAICKDADRSKSETIKELASFEPSEYIKTGTSSQQNIELYVRLTCEKGGLFSFAYSLDGKKYTKAGESFQAREGRWIGAKMGLFSIAEAGNMRGWIDCYEWNITTK